MQRLLVMLVPAVFFFFLRRVLTPADGPQNGDVAAAQLAIVRFLSERLAGGLVSDEAVGLVFAVMLLLAGFMGYVLHAVLQEYAFGPWLNGMLCFFGAAGADAAFVALAPRSFVAEPPALVMISSIGARLPSAAFRFRQGGAARASRRFRLGRQTDRRLPAQQECSGQPHRRRRAAFLTRPALARSFV